MQGPDPEPTADARGALAANTALASALDWLVDEAAVGDVESLERGLLRALVELGLAETAGIWRCGGAPDDWLPVLSFGGTTPPPPVGFTSPACQSFAFTPERRVVVSHAPCTPQHTSEEHADTIAALVALTATLADACPRRNGTASPLPRTRHDAHE